MGETERILRRELLLLWEKPLRRERPSSRFTVGPLPSRFTVGRFFTFCSKRSKRSKLTIPACSAPRVKPSQTACFRTQLPYVKGQGGPPRGPFYGRMCLFEVLRGVFLPYPHQHQERFQHCSGMLSAISAWRMCQVEVGRRRVDPPHYARVGRQGGIGSSRGTSHHPGYTPSRSSAWTSCSLPLRAR